MTVSLELDREARARGLASQFVPTGQTGIAIAGWGIAVDAVVADFIAGAAERLVVEGRERGGELLLVEGQGSLVAPGVLRRHARALSTARRRTRSCSATGPATTEIEGYPGHPLPSLAELVELHERISLPARPAKVAAIALNTRAARRRRGARAAIAAAEAETGLPADDPVRFGAGPPARRRACAAARTTKDREPLARARSACASRAADAGVCGCGYAGDRGGAACGSSLAALALRARRVSAARRRRHRRERRHRQVRRRRTRRPTSARWPRSACGRPS